MLNGKRILAVVPARGGSKGIPLKNIYPLAGRPLIAYTADVVKQLEWIDLAVVSTDSENIAHVAREAGLSVPFMRPEPISGDRIGDWDVLTHALEECEKLNGCVYDIVIMLQPTSPFRKASHVAAAVNRLIEGRFDSVWTLSRTDSKAHPLKQLVINDELFDYYDPAGANIIARQQLCPLYHRNGVAYAITRSCLLDQKSIKGTRASAVVIEDPLVNIDTLEDIEWADYLLAKGRISL
ncbi:MAG: acylneuraminate cytidylyltransferase family protein [Kiritimatiellae bacterium]|nr:acylneuraminate cytidylyltransferase family protein [Kiritimatiellia bacterium]